MIDAEVRVHIDVHVFHDAGDAVDVPLRDVIKGELHNELAHDVEIFGLKPDVRNDVSAALGVAPTRPDRALSCLKSSARSPSIPELMLVEPSVHVEELCHAAAR